MEIFKLDFQVLHDCIHPTPTVHRLQVTDLGQDWCTGVFENISPGSKVKLRYEALYEIIPSKVSLLEAGTFIHSYSKYFFFLSCNS